MTSNNSKQRSLVRAGVAASAAGRELKLNSSHNGEPEAADVKLGNRKDSARLATTLN